MSADNWYVCPQCAGNFKRLEESLSSKYGTVPQSDYLALVLEHARQKDAREKDRFDYEQTLRHDFSCEVDDTMLIIQSTLNCDRCGLKHKFTHKENILK